MAKKIEKQLNTHRLCKMVCVVKDEFLNWRGEPIMGTCVYSENRFLLNEKTDCKNYEKIR